MPKKSKIAAWNEKDLTLLRNLFADMPTSKLAAKMGRSVRSVAGAAAREGLLKSSDHRSRQARQSALAAGCDSARMAALGSRGGKIGGPARAAALTPAKRTKIAKAAVKARWAKRKR